MSALLALSVVTVLGAAPEYSVMVTRRIGVDVTKADALALKLATALEGASGKKLGVLVAPAALLARVQKAGARDPTACAGAAVCAAELGARLGLLHVVSLQLAAIGSSLTLDAALLEVPSGKPLGVSTLSMKGDPELGPVAAALVEALPELVAEAGTDRPSASTVVPAGTETSLKASVMPAKRKVALGAGAGALVAVGLGIALGLTAQSQAAQLKGNLIDLKARQDAVRGLALGADISYGLGAGLAATAIVLWFTSAPARPPDAVTWRLVPTGRDVVLSVTW